MSRQSLKLLKTLFIKCCLVVCLVRKKSLLSGTLAFLVTLFFISPLDDILAITALSYFLLPIELSIWQSLIIGVVVGLIVYVLIEFISKD